MLDLWPVFAVHFGCSLRVVVHLFVSPHVLGRTKDENIHTRIIGRAAYIVWTTVLSQFRIYKTL